MIRVSNLFHIVFKGNPKARFVMTLKVLLWDLKDVVSSPIKVTTENHSHTIRTGRSKVAATKSTTANDLNLWVGSQSHKWEVYVQQIQDRRVRWIGATRGSVS